ncbi:MAG: HAMP domain-containing histidine kinase [Anaerolineae bacterium]|nr:HAMP domain-containing histidine kinase [Anaerolineae bacterium]
MTDSTPKPQSEFISTIVHDLKTPITAVKGFIELIEQAGTLNPAQKQFSDKAIAVLGRMHDLVDDLLDLAKLDAGVELHLHECDIQVFIQEALETLESIALQRQITVQVEIGPEVRPIRADARLLRQVINNLLSNAIKYNRDQGTVNIRVSEQPGSLRVDVRDTGMGIRSEDQTRVFEPFYRGRGSAKAEGTGLGLAIVEMIIRKHGGRIWVESKLNEGSVFSFNLPRQRKSSHTISNEFSSEESDGVDDSFQDSNESLDSDSRSDQGV